MNASDDLLDELLGGSTKAKDFDRETLQKILELNPQLTASPDAMLDDAKARAKEEGEGERQMTRLREQASGAGAIVQPLDLDSALEYLEKKHRREQREIDEEMKRLTERRRSLTASYREQMMDRLFAIDPNMASPKTSYVLTDKKRWLDEIGFSVAAFVAHGRLRRKR